MKVVHISTYDVSGGAAIAAHRLHQGLLEARIDSRMLVREKQSGCTTISQIEAQRPTPLWKRLISERLARARRARYFRDGTPDTAFHDIHSEFRPADFQSVLEADLVHLHWTCGYLDWPSTLPWLARQKPLVWTFHDLHAPLGVLNYRPTGSLSPSFAAWEAKVLQQKKEILDAIPSDRLQVIAPSRWMAETARQSPAFGRFTVHHIPSGLPTESFKPMDKALVRAALGLPASGTVLGIAAQSLSDPRKGMSVLLQALRCLDASVDPPVLLTVGSECPEVAGIHMLHLGESTSERMLSLFYNAIDLFVCPSLQDNLPNTVLEAMSCGVPVVAFDVGGIPDMVRPGETGWLANRVGDASSLAAAITDALRDSHERAKRSAACRSITEMEYDESLQAATVASVYQVALGMRNHNPASVGVLL